jgi:nucleotide-binding universal stress UspA family protein
MLRAREDYRKATQSARRHRLWARLTGRKNALLPFEDVRQSLGFKGQRYSGLQPVPLDKIVGSMGRARDFDRVFMPTQTHSRGKWVSVDSAYLSGVVLPPVSLYKLGEYYFVVDGHHRVSVARQKNQAFIDAEVIEVQSRVSVTEDMTLDDLDVLAAYREFLEQTKLDALRPDQDVHLTMPGDYVKLIDHIRTHKYFVEIEQSRELTWEEAVAHWYDRVYRPPIEIVRRRKLLKDFPGMTEGDLYFSIISHSYYLSQQLGRSVTPQEVASDFVERYGRSCTYVLKRAWNRVLDLLVPEEFESGPRAGTWREERVVSRPSPHLFHDILVTLTGAETGWRALTQAAEFARREHGVLHGLHVMTENTPDAQVRADAIISEFQERTRVLQVKATAKIVPGGDVAEEIVQRARWYDLVVINQRRVHGRWEERPLGTIFQSVASRSSCPLLAVPGAQVTPLKRVLLAYDGSVKAREALFIFKHLLSCWEMEGVILTIESASTDRSMLEAAQQYAQEAGGSPVKTIFTAGVPEEVILGEMSQQSADLLLLGGFGHQPLVKAFLGSTVGRVLRMAWFPVLICR